MQDGGFLPDTCVERLTAAFDAWEVCVCVVCVCVLCVCVCFVSVCVCV